MNQQVETEKWYRIPMVWLMIGLPMVAVVASLTTVVIAYKKRTSSYLPHPVLPPVIQITNATSIAGELIC